MESETCQGAEKDKEWICRERQTKALANGDSDWTKREMN